ncbi:SDR family NAD(P)-dependent oxidoreductase [Spiroplasma turonicum]|nr:SDR family NAD(P)-dependent oxidoreductase [Spiroplasma turonicum]ALX71199.1 short-chain dehydrogenase/reductase SDR [Spiroplasma turonicum]
MNINKIKWINKQDYILITGASKGLGFEFVNFLSQLGIPLICVSRSTESLKKFKKDNNIVESNLIIFSYDLSVESEVFELLHEIKDYKISTIINNAGFGLYGLFSEVNLEKELNMIDLNIKALHILTKKFVEIFNINNYGRIINIASMASFSPGGPLYSTYYATKAYVLSLGQSVNTELKKNKSKVRVVTICPGPLKTEFWKTSIDKKVSKNKKDIKVKTMDLKKYSRKSLYKALKTKNKNYIILGAKNKLLRKCTKIFGDKTILNNVYKFQKSKLI